MKTLYLFRSSLKDGAIKDTIDLKGMERAMEAGRFITDEDNFLPINHLFWGVLPRTVETAVGFVLGYQDHAHMDVQTHDPLPWFGTDAMFKELFNDAARKLVGCGGSNFEAVKHGHESIFEFLCQAPLEGLQIIFSRMAHRQAGAGFFHSPTIEMAIYALYGFKELIPRNCFELQEMEGLVLEQTRSGLITVARRITLTEEGSFQLDSVPHSSFGGG